MNLRQYVWFVIKRYVSRTSGSGCDKIKDRDTKTDDSHMKNIRFGYHSKKYTDLIKCIVLREFYIGSKSYIVLKEEKIYDLL